MAKQINTHGNRCFSLKCCSIALPTSTLQSLLDFFNVVDFWLIHSQRCCITCQMLCSQCDSALSCCKNEVESFAPQQLNYCAALHGLWPAQRQNSHPRRVWVKLIFKNSCAVLTKNGWTPSVFVTDSNNKNNNNIETMTTRMWANVQRDGRPSECRWRPLSKAANFGWRPLLECRAVTLPRRELRWNLLGCPKRASKSQMLVRRSLPLWGYVGEALLFNNFFRLSIHALVAKI